MIRHISALTFVDGVTEDQVRAIADALATLPAQIPELRDYRVGRDLAVDPGNATFAVVADFDTIDDYRTYRDHPAHRKIGAELIRPLLAARSAVQYEI